MFFENLPQSESGGLRTDQVFRLSFSEKSQDRPQICSSFRKTRSRTPCQKHPLHTATSHCSRPQKSKNLTPMTLLPARPSERCCHSCFSTLCSRWPPSHCGRSTLSKPAASHRLRLHRTQGITNAASTLDFGVPSFPRNPDHQS